MNQGSKKTIRTLCFAVLGMFTFSFALVPLYDVFCEVTGLNGKIELRATNNTNIEIDDGRDVSIQFVSHNNEEMPWTFEPSEDSIKIKTGKYHTATFYVKNPTNRTMIAQAIPSVAPSNAASHLKKLECFCFEQQELAPGEDALLPVRLIFDDKLPSSINSVVLSYTIFDVTDYDDIELTQNTHKGHVMESSL
jgi:cytochrome c oxidase assembly protein subunit 11|tara:strand:+ start:2815 stop:3393 length:579 start_codon:yes stop_codon:yes gene_type:complete